MPLPHYPPELLSQRPPEGFSDDELGAITQGYYAMISEVDHWVGCVLDALTEQGLADDTIVVFCSDHGEWLGEHFRFGKGYWAPDVVSRVPLIVAVPDALGGASGRIVNDVVECVDVVPTLLQSAGIPIPPEVQGDLLPVGAEGTVCEGDGLGLNEHHGWKSLRMPSARYVAQADGSEHLYDLAADPWEYNDVADDASFAGLLADARRALIRRLIRIEQPLRREWPY